MMERKLPEGWEWKRLGDVATYINGRAFKPTEWTDNGKPIIRIQNLTDESNSFNYFNGECESRYCIKNGDILISWSASLGIFVWNRDDAFLNQHIFKAILNEKIIDRHFFVFVIRTILEDMKRKTHGSTMKHIIKSEFNNTPIPLPPIETQRKIVAILEKADETKRLRMQADELANQLLQSVFLEMFGDPVKNPKRWEISTLESVCSELYRYPTFYGFEYFKTGVPVVRIGNICSNGSLDPDVSNYVFIESKLNENFPRTILEFNDIVMAVRGDGSTAKRIGLVNTMNLVGANISPNLIRFKTKNKILNPLFLFNLMISDGGQRLLEKYVTRTAKKTITAKDIKKILIPIPPLPLQQKFAQIVEKVEAMHQNQKQSRQEIDNLFNALTQKAFKGELTT
jgi:type I restriction enzyme S subunit